MGSLLVHGWMVTARVWSWFAPRLTGEVVAPTTVPAPSERATATLETLATNVLGSATSAGLQRFDLIGHSMGGQLAALIAATAPERVRSLTLVNPIPLSGMALPANVVTFFRTSGGNRAAQGTILDRACLQLPPEAKQTMLDDAATVAPEWIARSSELFIAGGDISKLAAIRSPTLVVTSDDPFLPPAYLEQTMVSKIKGARMEYIPGVGHYPQVEQPDALASVVGAFLAEVDR